MGKAINALVNAADEESESSLGTKLTFLDFSVPKTGVRERFIKKQNTKVPHERVILAVREVKYLRDGFVREENITRKIVLESHGTEIVEEVLVPREKAMIFSTGSPRVVGSVTRDLRRKDDQV